MRVLLLVLLCLACGGLPPDSAPWPQAGYPINGPDVVFSVGPENENAVRWGLSRWNTSTGWSASVAASGAAGASVPVEFPQFSPDGRCGETSITHRGKDVLLVHYVYIYLPAPDGCADTLSTLIHELGHALCGLDADNCHSVGGVQKPTHQRGSVINQSTLDTVCARWGCPDPKPELMFDYPAPLVAPDQ